MAGPRLLTKILADFLFGFYLLNYVLKYATNHTQNRYAKLIPTQIYFYLSYTHENIWINTNTDAAVKL